MPPHPIGSGTITFGLVSIPVRMYSATAGAGISFNQLHAKCGSRIKQQILCPVCNEIVERNQLVKGYEFAKDQYVQFTPDELKALEGESSPSMEIEEFLPLETVDPVFYERTYFLGPDKGGEKAYKLLAQAMSETKRAALARVVMRGKESLVLVRPAQGGLLLHTMYFGHEVRDFGEIEKGDAKVKEGELGLATRLIDELASKKFEPEKYKDEYHERVMEQIERKVEGKEITSVSPETHKTQVIDLMDALKQSLEKRGGAAETKSTRKPAAKATKTSATQEKKKTARR
jgi:DNA end-binding protein Ku